MNEQVDDGWMESKLCYEKHGRLTYCKERKHGAIAEENCKAINKVKKSSIVMLWLLNEWTGRQTDEWMDGWTFGMTDRWMNG